jgi:hypothetical protein
MKEGNSYEVNQRISSIYEENRLINEFVEAFKRIIRK